MKLLRTALGLVLALSLAVAASAVRAQLVIGQTLLGPHARGTIVSQVFPERALGIPTMKQAHDLAHGRQMSGVTPAMLEGFAAAKCWWKA